MSILYPNNHYNSVHEIDYKQLQVLGVKAIIFDIDNTLVPYDILEPTPQVIGLIEKLQKDGFKLCLISNNNKNRVDLFNKELKLPAIAKAYKPLSKNIKKGLALLGSQADQTALIGDQMFTDVWGGNRVGLFTILVRPIQDKEEWITKIKRGIEKKVFKKYISKKEKTND
ncbi:MAG: YqeG family HAD IIIA-type phosphatase [Vallitaleaceae bacterium]|jgi:HAD superfamily phosphatase (TIGR01668 family)|nr:YqeG family HAD IIIA-type phosphatase [Vallitaleaceae bacterium]